MALTQVTGPYPIFTDLDGSPLDDGYLYIGAANQDPETNPIQVFWDINLSIPATQPIRTNNGYAWRNGTPGMLYTNGEFSITVRNKRNEFVLTSPVGYGLVGTTTVEQSLLALNASASRTGSIAFDDFDCPDTILNGRVTPSGHTWSVTGPGALTAAVVNKVFTSDQNCYASLNYGAQIGYVAGVFSISGSVGNTQSAPSAVLIAQAADGTLATMLHFQCRWDGWSVEKRIAAGPFIGIAQGKYNLDWNGAPYRCAMRISGNTVVIETPDGEIVTVTDPDIGATPLTIGTWQITGGGSTSALDTVWHGAAIGESTQAKFAVLNSAATPGDLARVAGVGYGERTSRSYTISANGTYRVAYNEAISSGFAMFGNVKMDISGGVVYDFIDFDVSAVAPSAPLLQLNNSSGGYYLDVVRVGSDASNVYIDIIVTNVTTPVTLNVTNEGLIQLYPKLIASPVTPAVTKSLTVTTPQQTSYTYTYNTTGWTRLSGVATGPGGYLISGVVRIKAYDAARTSQMDIVVNGDPSTFFNPIEITNCVGMNNPITQIRMSRETNNVALDVYCAFAGTNPITIEAEYIGWFNPPSSLSPATALATETITANVTQNYEDIRRVINTVDINNSFQIISASTGGTTSLTDNDTGVHLYGSIASYTINLPPNPLKNHPVSISVQNGGSVTVTGQGTFTIAANQVIQFMYYEAIAAWVRIQ